MPELPEVETVARQLAPQLTGRRVRDFRILDPRLRDTPPPPLRSRKVLGVRRSGKRVRIRFSARRAGDGEVWLAVHLRMTGRLIWCADGVRADSAHLRARVRLEGGRLLFYDTRRFGTFQWFSDERAAEPLGVDPLSRAFTPASLARMLTASRQGMKAFLMRQDRLVGLGNIYASEILHRARLSPHRATSTLAGEEVARLHAATRSILRRAIRNCGTTFSDFQDSRGDSGSYQRFLQVYGREGERCPRCEATLERDVQQQRSTFWCPGCQV